MPLTADVPLDEVVYLDFITSRFDTGAATDADSTPTFEVFEESTDTDIGVGGNATKRTSKTGNYRVSFTCSAANGFEVGKWYSVVASATVNSVAGKACVGTFRVVAAEAIAGKPKVDVDAWLGSAAATPTVAGVPEVDITHIGGTGVTAAAGIPEVKVASIANGAVTAAAVATGAIDADAIATDGAQEIADALLDRANGVETGFTLRQALRLILSALAGKVSGAGTTNVVIRDVNDAKNRLSAVVDSDGNRTSVTKDVT